MFGQIARRSAVKLTRSCNPTKSAAFRTFKLGLPEDSTSVPRPSTTVPQSQKEPTASRRPLTSPEFYNIPEDKQYFDRNRPLRYLVAMDFSQNSMRALKMAKQLLQPQRGDLIVVYHVPIWSVPSSFMDSGVFTPDFAREVKDQAEKRLEGIRIQCQDVSGHFVVEMSEPSLDAREIIMKRLEEQDASHRIDVVVCGHRGGSRLTQFMHLGSIANYLAMYSPCSLVLVR